MTTSSFKVESADPATALRLAISTVNTERFEITQVAMTTYINGIGWDIVLSGTIHEPKDQEPPSSIPEPEY